MIDVDNDYLDQVEAQLVELTERGAHRRLRARAAALSEGAGSGRGEGGGRGPRVRAGALAFGLAVLVVATVVVVALGTLHSGSGSPASGRARHGVHPTSPATRHGVHHARTTTSTPSQSNPASGSTSPSGPVPPGFEPESFTAINELTWWLLGTAPCSQAPCTSIVRTTDGGVSFAGIPAPRAPLTTTSSQTGISELRFADAENGFAYGGALYVTHDAGQSWQALNLGGRVIDLAIAAGRAYAIVGPTGAGGNRLMSSFVGQDDWTAVTAAGAVADGLWARGSDVFVESAGEGDLLVSHDDGVTFARHPSPSPGLGCDFQELSPPVVWAHCSTGMMSKTWRSTNGGATFQLASGTSTGPESELPNSAAFAAASATTAVVGYQQLYQTSDGGESYAPVAGPAGITWWQYLGFTDATHGVGLGYQGTDIPSHERLYYTTDGGLSYHLVSIP